MGYDWKQLSAKIAKVGMTFLATGGIAAIGGAAPTTVLLAGLTGEAISGGLGEIVEGIVSGIQPKEKGVYTRFRYAINDCVAKQLEKSDCPRNKLKDVQSEIMDTLFGLPVNALVAATIEPNKAAAYISAAFSKNVPDHVMTDEAAIAFVDDLFSELVNLIDNDHEFTTTVYLKDLVTKVKSLQVTADETLRVTAENDIKLSQLIELINEILVRIDGSRFAPIPTENNELLNAKELRDYISNRKEIVQNQAIFPWFYDSLKYREVFPELFVFPKFETRHGKCDFKELLTLKNQHLAILGKAGSGKSTLLRYIFAFDKLNDVDCFYMTAEETLDETPSFFKKLQEQKIVPIDKRPLIVFIDGIDEAYYNDPNGYKHLITKLKNVKGCYFWLGCRSDYYDRVIGEHVIFVHEHLTLQPWDDVQSDHFIYEYAKIVKCAQLPERINSLLNQDPSLKMFKENPFQLALLVFLAENNEKQVTGLYDLYEKFVRQWLDKEQKRGTCKDTDTKILEELHFAAEEIYNGRKYRITEIAENNTAIKNLLVVDNVSMMGVHYATLFYHRSLAAFFLARNTIEAMLENASPDRLKKLFSYKLKDDVTNFIGDGFSLLTIGEKCGIKKNLINLYEVTSDHEKDLCVKEQAIYFITRLGIDVSDFLLHIINPRPTHPIMRLTLAYGCVLSDVPEVKKFAFEYAKSIASNSNDATTNRAWTVVYFGDVIADPYKYKDDEKCSWFHARAARIKRFTKKNPRPKDYRFRLFDIPLFHSFLIDREWDNLSQEELNILSRITLPKEHFNEEELEFLASQKEMLLVEYRRHLKTNAFQGMQT